MRVVIGACEKVEYPTFSNTQNAACSHALCEFIFDPPKFGGFCEGLTADEIWEPGRAAWRMRAEKVLACGPLVFPTRE